MRRGGGIFLLLLLVPAARAAICRDERIIVGSPVVLPASTAHEVAREVEVQVRTCEGSVIDKLLSEKKPENKAHLRLAFQDIQPNEITIIGEEPMKRSGSRPMVLIDAGRPETTSAPLPNVRSAAERLARTHPDWEYRFIQGDETRCLISDPQISNPKAGPAFAMVPHPLDRENLEAMAATFSNPDAPRSLIVIAAEAPVWLPREVTEWFIDASRVPIEDEEHRKAMGSAEQLRIVDRGVAGLLIGRLFESNRLVLASEPTKDPKNKLSTTVWTVAQKHGGMVPLNKMAATNAPCGVPVSHTGMVRFDMSAVRKHPSGEQPFEVQLVDAKNNVLLRASQRLPDATRRDWERQLVGELPALLMVIGVILAIFFVLLALMTRDPAAFADFRNAAIGVAGTCLGIALAILPNAETAAHRDVFGFAMYACFIALGFAGIFAILALDVTRQKL